MDSYCVELSFCSAIAAPRQGDYIGLIGYALDSASSGRTAALDCASCRSQDRLGKGEVAFLLRHGSEGRLTEVAFVLREYGALG